MKYGESFFDILYLPVCRLYGIKNGINILAEVVTGGCFCIVDGLLQVCPLRCAE